LAGGLHDDSIGSIEVTCKVAAKDLKLAGDLHDDSIACKVAAKDSKLAGDLHDNLII